MRSVFGINGRLVRLDANRVQKAGWNGDKTVAAQPEG